MREVKGFTLIEVLLVIIILGLLSSMIVPRIVGRAGKAREDIARTDIEGGLSEVLDLYELDTGKYPASLQDLVQQPGNTKNWNGPYIKKKKIPTDPWGNAYIYTFPGTHNSGSYDLSSAGADGVEGSEDDIVNWE